ncbi:MAG: hypothetical protein HFG20_00895 [Anaerotruncus sp.]|nr:hypothetical protein [Anaerotruncus sp.]
MFTGTTGADGTYLLKDLEPGWYIVTEIQVSEGYLLDSSPHYIELKGGQDSELTVTNKHKPSLKIVKYDETTKQPLQFAKFRISIKNGKILGEYTTDANGEILLEEIDPQLYVIQELAAPNGYILMDDSKEALVEWGKTTIVEFYNQPKNPLLIKKVDTKTGEPLEKAKFLVTKVNGELVGEYETGRNGFITVTNLEPGFYTVKETKAPLGYILDDTPKTVELKRNEPAVVEFENEPLNGLHIKKIDSLTKEPFMGAIFRVSEKEGRLIGNFETDAQGEIVVNGLQPGWYTIEETEAPAGYAIDETPKDVEFIWGQFINVEFVNSRKAPLQVKKVDAKTGTPLMGAKFRAETVEGKFIGEYETDRTGFFAVDELDAGWYVMTEIKAPVGYRVDSTPHNIEVVLNKPAMLEITNELLSPLQILKVDADTNEPLKGASFEIIAPDGHSVGSFTTNAAGILFVPQLKEDWYRVTETAAPDGYLPDNTPQKVYVKANDATVLQIGNKRLSQVQIKKEDKQTGEALAGAQFCVTRATGELAGEYTTGSGGLIQVPQLSPGSYIITETCAPDGYKLDNAGRTIQVRKDAFVQVEFTNERLPGLQVVKLDAVTKTPLADARFKVEKLSGERIGEFKTNAAGFFALSDLEPGWYNIYESRAPEGYRLDSTPQTVELKRDKTAVVEFEDQPLVGMKIKKVNAVTGKPISGVEFKVTTMEQTPVGTFTTNEDGMIFVPEMQAGFYIVTETKAASGYKADTAPRMVEIKAGELNIVEYKNQPYPILSVKKVDADSGKVLPGVKFKLFDRNSRELGTFTTNQLGQIQIVKTAADDNPITRAKAGAALSGAKFEIYNERLEVVDIITTDSRGVATLKELPVGTYGIKEVEAPACYAADGKVFYAQIRAAKDLVRFEVQNRSEVLEVSVEKRGNVEVLAGEWMRYDFSNIRNKSNIDLEDFYWHDQLPAQVRLERIYTGTWSQKLSYSIWYKTNHKKDYKLLEEKLSTQTETEIDCTKAALGLAADEYVTDVKLEFGTVEPGFCETSSPHLVVTTLPELPKTGI